jgi:hypothetical protein
MEGLIALLQSRGFPAHETEAFVTKLRDSDLNSEVKIKEFLPKLPEDYRVYAPIIEFELRRYHVIPYEDIDHDMAAAIFQGLVDRIPPDRAELMSQFFLKNQEIDLFDCIEYLSDRLSLGNVMECLTLINYCGDCLGEDFESPPDATSLPNPNSSPG